MLNWVFSHKPQSPKQIAYTNPFNRTGFLLAGQRPASKSWRMPRVFCVPDTTFHSNFTICEAEILTFNFKTIKQ